MFTALRNRRAANARRMAAPIRHGMYNATYRGARRLGVARAVSNVRAARNARYTHAALLAALAVTLACGGTFGFAVTAALVAVGALATLYMPVAHPRHVYPRSKVTARTMPHLF